MRGASRAARPLEPSSARISGPWQHRDVYANGIRLHVAELGSGPVVLLLHGFAGFWWSWNRCVEPLAEAGFRVVAADLRGYGDSDKPPRGYDLWTLSGDVAGLIRSLGQHTAHVVGHGWGGVLAWSTAALHPSRVESVGVLGGAHPLALRSAIRRTALRREGANQARASSELLRAQLPLRPEQRLTTNSAAYVETLLLRWGGRHWPAESDFADVAARHRDAMLIQGVAHSALEYYRWAFRSQFRGDGRRFAGAVSDPVRAPVLQLHGSADPCVLPQTARDSTPWAGPRSRFETQRGTAHLPHLRAPRDTVATLRDFLRRTCA